MPSKNRMKNRTSFFIIGGALTVFSLAFVFYFIIPRIAPLSYETEAVLGEIGATSPKSKNKEPVFVVTHIPTPEAVRAIYMTQCVAGTPSFRERLITLIEETELNSVIVDIKDFSGGLGFKPTDPVLKEFLSPRCYASDLREFIGRLHEKGIYTIARITVFQDPLFAKKHPHLAVKKLSDKNTLWSDYKGLNFIDPGAREAWNYIIAISREAYVLGFDELNYDYIRFPSDGNMRDIYYPWSEEQIIADPDFGKAKVLRDFFTYLDKALSDLPVILSADLFGMTMTNPDDLNIGQVLEYVEPYFDYIAPMVYPSHYPKGFNGHERPATAPYAIVRFSMDRGALRLLAASSTPSKLRPWLQDFDLGAVYDADMVRAQIQATYDAGLDSWMLWDPANTYTREALLPNTQH